MVLYFNANEQRHYTQHIGEVTAVTVSPEGLVASAEHKDTTEIHVWELATRKRIHHLVGLHQSEVYLMRFIKGGRFLLSCGKRENSSLIVTDLSLTDSHVSTKINFFARNILRLISTVGEFRSLAKQRTTHDSTFFLFGRDRIMKNNCLHFDYRAEPVMIADAVTCEVGPMTTGLFVLVNAGKGERSELASKLV